LEDENIQEMVQENCDNLLPLLQQIPGCEKIDDDDTQEWMEKDEQQELTIALLNWDDSQDEDNDTDTGLGLDKTDRMSHSKGVKDLKVALGYAEQQGETTATDVMLLRCWCSLATRKRSKAEKQTSIIHFFKQ
jgi:hypothetical protein